MKISLCMNTAREDYSMIGFPNIHIFEYLMRSLRRQTYKNFEVVIADVLYDKRSNYFKEHPEDFEIKHVPIKPNVWLPREFMAISTCKNTAILHATGDIISFIDDCGEINSKNFEAAIKMLDGKENLILCSAYKLSLGINIIEWGLKPIYLLTVMMRCLTVAEDMRIVI